MLGLYVCAMEGLYLRCCRQMDKLREQSAEEAYRSDPNPNPSPDPSPSSVDRALSECLASTSFEQLSVVFKSSEAASDAMAMAREGGVGSGFWASDGRCTVTGSERSRANIRHHPAIRGRDWVRARGDMDRDRDRGQDPEEAGELHSVALTEGCLLPPIGGVSFNLRPVLAGSQHLAALGLRFDLLLPGDLALTLSASGGGCLPGICGTLLRSTGTDVGAGDEGRVEEVRFDARFRFSASGSLSFLWSSNNNSKGEMRTLTRSSSQLQRGTWQSFSAVLATGAQTDAGTEGSSEGAVFLRACVDGQTVLAAKVPSLRIAEAAAKMSVFVSDCSQLADKRLLLRNIHLAGQVVH